MIKCHACNTEENFELRLRETQLTRERYIRQFRLENMRHTCEFDLSYDASISNLLGKTIVAINGLEKDSRQVQILTSDDYVFTMEVPEDCCNDGYVADVTGDIQDLIGSPITMAEESSRQGDGEEPEQERAQDSWTWTFYKLATIKGYVDIRFFGTSNGYYAEKVGVEYAKGKPAVDAFNEKKEYLCLRSKVYSHGRKLSV